MILWNHKISYYVHNISVSNYRKLHCLIPHYKNKRLETIMLEFDLYKDYINRLFSLFLNTHAHFLD
jgi:hypothetical protein